MAEIRKIDDWQSIIILDNALPLESFNKMSIAMMAAPYQLWRISEVGTISEQFPCDYLQAELDHSDFEDNEAFKFFLDIAKSYLTSQRQIVCDRVFSNAFQYGDTSYTHKDFISGKPGLSVLLFLNSKWEADWGGELTFFNENLEAVTSVTPRPNRAVVFSNDIYHRAGLPARICPDVRLTLNVRFVNG